MLADDRARARISAFHRSYIGMQENSRWDTAIHDPDLFPDFDDAVNRLMADEVESFFDYVTYKPGTFQDLLLDSTGFVNAQTAAYYELPETEFADALEPATLDPVERPGFLTRLGFLNAYSQYDRSSPILRGAFIVDHVVGLELGAPPPGATDVPLPEPSAELDTNRKRVALQTSGGSCAGCHQVYINPIGFALENFDAVGRHRTMETNGAPIDAQSDVLVGGDQTVTVSTPLQLMTELSQSASAQRHYAESWLEFAYERPPNEFDDCVVQQMGARITAGGYTILQLVTDLTQTESFKLRRVEN